MTNLKAVFVVFFVAVSFSAQAQAATSSGKSAVRRSHLTSTEVAHSSQANDESDLIGVLTGLGFANASATVPDNAQQGGLNMSNRMGLNFQAYYEHRFVSYLGLQAGLRYAPRGFSQPLAGDPTGQATETWAVNYLELPIYAKTQIRAGAFTPYFELGPFLGLAMSKTVSANNQDTPIDNGINGMNFGLDFGGGTYFEIARSVNLELNLRYSLGMTNVLTNANPGVALHLNSLQLMTGVAVAL